MAALQIRTWINGLVLLAFGVGISATIDGHHLPAGAAAALIVIAGLLTARTLIGSAIVSVDGRPIGAPSVARARWTAVIRQSDPDAPGRARPRAPGNAPLR